VKIVRFLDENSREHYGCQKLDGSVSRLEGDLYHERRDTGEVVQITKLLAPIVPTDILGIGLNYRRHAEESKMPLPEQPIVFMKTCSSVQHPEDPIELPRAMPSDSVDYECELAVVIGRKCKNVSRETALDFVLGYTCANDVSARDWQLKKGGGQWSRGKTFDTFCPMGPALVTTDEIADPHSLQIRTLLNDKVMQDWSTGDMIFDVPALIEFLSASTTLLPGTVILTGTPQGVGFARNPPVYLRPGDRVTIEIEGIGQLNNYVVEEDLSSST